MRCFGHLARGPPFHLLDEMFQACSAGRGMQSRPRILWRGYFSQLTWDTGSCGFLQTSVVRVLAATTHAARS